VEPQPWLDAVRKEFVRRKLPLLYIERLMEELSDHFNNFMEDRMNKDVSDLESVAQELGRPSDLGALAADQYGRQRFSRRHPWLVFAVMPIVLLPILFVGLLFGIGWMAYFLTPADVAARLESAEPWWGEFVFRLIVCAELLIPAIVLAAFSCRIARKAALGWKWPLATCLLLALLSGSVFTGTRAKTADRPGVLLIGVGVSPHSTSGLQLLQFAAPLAIGTWAAWRHRAGRSAPLAI
jgi:nitrate reductase NapE component